MGVGMIDLAQIETAVRAASSGGSWRHYFRREGDAWQCILFPKNLLSEQDYQTLVRHLNAPETDELTPTERKRNAIRALADRADRYAR